MAPREGRPRGASDRGAGEDGFRTFKVLRLNTRSDLVEARYRSWRGVIRVFEQAARARHFLDADDVENPRFQPVVDAFHHFAHDVGAGRLAHKSVPPDLAAFAVSNLPTLRAIFPDCRL